MQRFREQDKGSGTKKLDYTTGKKKKSDLDGEKAYSRTGPEFDNGISRQK